MNELHFLSPFPVELLVKSGIVIAIGFGLALAFRKSAPDWKHRILIQSFSVAILIPLVLMLPRWEVLPARQPAALPELPDSDAVEQVTFSRTSAAPAISAPAAKTKWSPSLTETITTLWLAGIAFLLLRMLVAGIRLRRLSQSAVIPSKRIRELFQTAATGTKTGSISLHLSDEVTSPFSHGLARPAVFLPLSAEDWSDEELDMIFRHELAHVKRRDGIAVLLSRLFLAVNWINPLAWVANHFAIRFREEACDESVLAAGHSPTAYAEMLFRQASKKNDRFLQTCATAMAETGTIEQRIQMILKPSRSIHRRPSHFAKLGAASFTLLFLIIGFVGSQTVSNKTSPIETTLKETLIPRVEFQDTPLKDALRFLGQKGGGLNIILNAPESADTKITLRLSNVPLAEALRYTSNLAQLNYRVDANAVVVEPIDKKDRIRKGWDRQIKHGDGPVAQKLQSIIIPSIEFKDTPLRDAIDFLVLKSKELDDSTDDREKKGFNIVVNASSPGVDSVITLRLTNVPIGEALRYTTSLANLQYYLDSNAVVISDNPAPVTGDLYTEVFEVGRTAATYFRNAKNAKDALEAAGVRFGEGGSAIFNEATSRLIVRNVNGELDLTKEFLRKSEAGQLPMPAAEGADAVTQKLDFLVIPKAEFRDTPLRDALQFLQQKSVELDSESAPESKGINIILEEGDRAKGETVTLKVTNVSLGNVLRYVGDQVGFTYEAEPNAVVFRPKN